MHDEPILKIITSKIHDSDILSKQQSSKQMTQGTLHLQDLLHRTSQPNTKREKHEQS